MFCDNVVPVHPETDLNIKVVQEHGRLKDCGNLFFFFFFETCFLFIFLFLFSQSHTRKDTGDTAKALMEMAMERGQPERFLPGRGQDRTCVETYYCSLSPFVVVLAVQIDDCLHSFN